MSQCSVLQSDYIQSHVCLSILDSSFPRNSKLHLGTDERFLAKHKGMLQAQSELCPERGHSAIDAIAERSKIFSKVRDSRHDRTPVTDFRS